MSQSDALPFVGTNTRMPVARIGNHCS